MPLSIKIISFPSRLRVIFFSPRPGACLQCAHAGVSMERARLGGHAAYWRHRNRLKHANHRPLLLLFGLRQRLVASFLNSRLSRRASAAQAGVSSGAEGSSRAVGFASSADLTVKGRSQSHPPPRSSSPGGSMCGTEKGVGGGGGALERCLRRNKEPGQHGYERSGTCAREKRLALCPSLQIYCI